MIFDTKVENYISIGYDWPPIVLGKGEIMVQELVLEYIDSSIGDKVTIKADFSGFFGDQALVKLFALMVFEIEDVTIDFETRDLVYQNNTSGMT